MICVPSSPWSLWGICLPSLGISRRINVPCSPRSLWGICLPSLGISRRLSVPSSPRPGCSSQEMERLLASEVGSVEPRLTVPTRDQEPRYRPAVEPHLTAPPYIPHCSVVTPHYTALATAHCLCSIINANKFQNVTIGFWTNATSKCLLKENFEFLPVIFHVSYIFVNLIRRRIFCERPLKYTKNRCRVD